MMAQSKYPNLNRVIREVQENTGVKTIDGLIGRNTEAAVAKALAGYDGNNVLSYLADLPHKQVEESKELDIPILDPRPEVSFKQNHPDYYSVAHAYIGLEEIAGAEHNPEIIEFWKLCHLPFRTDEIAWCAGFVGGCLEKCGIQSTRSGLARSYLDWGEECEHEIGAVVVFWRIRKRSTFGHVGLVAGPIDGGFVPTLGGNQGNKVCIKPYPVSRVLGYRKPKRK